MKGSVPSGKADALRTSLGGHKNLEQLVGFFQGQAKSVTGVGKAEWTFHVASAVHFNDAEAGMLLVVRTQSAIVGTSMMNLRSKGQRNGPRLVVFAERGIRLGIAVHKRFKRSAFRTALAPV